MNQFLIDNKQKIKMIVLPLVAIFIVWKAFSKAKAPVKRYYKRKVQSFKARR